MTDAVRIEYLPLYQPVKNALLSTIAQRVHDHISSCAHTPLLPQLPYTCVTSQTKVELLHKQDAQINELRRKHEAAQLAVDKAASSADGSGDMEERQQGEEKGDASGNEGNDDDDDRGLVASLRKVCPPSAVPYQTGFV